jgi:hydroxymethylbilane synthase
VFTGLARGGGMSLYRVGGHMPKGRALLARAGLLRLGRAGEVTELFDPLLMLPAPGQGALAVETRIEDAALQAALGLLDDASTRASVLAERALLARLEAGCAAPVGALAEVVEGEDGPELSLRAVVGSIDGLVTIRRSALVRLPGLVLTDQQVSLPLAAADAAIAEQLGRSLAEQMLDDGAADLIPEPTATQASMPTSGTAATAREGDS